MYIGLRKKTEFLDKSSKTIDSVRVFYEPKPIVHKT